MISDQEKYENEVLQHLVTISVLRGVCEGSIDPKRVEFPAYNQWKLNEDKGCEAKDEGKSDDPLE